MPPPFIPASDSAFDAFLYNFAKKILAAPAAYQLTSADASVIDAAYSLWHAAFLAASSPDTRTRGAVRTKDLQRASAVAVARRFAALIRVNQSVAPDLKIGLGIRPPTRSYTRINTPAERPVLAVASAGIAEHTIFAGRSDGEGRRPAGAIALVLFRSIADSHTEHEPRPEDAPFLGLVTRATFTSTFTTADAGKTATYFARWANAKGELGPWSPPVRLRIAA